MSMVSSSRTEVRRDFTSNNTVLILTMRSFMLLTVYLDWVKDDKSWVKYFASW